MTNLEGGLAPPPFTHHLNGLLQRGGSPTHFDNRAKRLGALLPHYGVGEVWILIQQVINARGVNVSGFDVRRAIGVFLRGRDEPEEEEIIRSDIEALLVFIATFLQ